jgi:hypothetical protein
MKMMDCALLHHPAQATQAVDTLFSINNNLWFFAHAGSVEALIIELARCAP